MMPFRTIGFLRLASIVAGGAFLCACTAWEVQPLQPERFRTADSTETVRLTLTTGTVLVVQAPVIAGDSLIGRQPQAANPDSLARVSIPLASITQLELPSSGALPTVGLVMMTIGLIAAMCTGFMCSGSR